MAKAGRSFLPGRREEGARDEEWVAMQGTPALEMGTRSLACSPPIGCQSLSALCSRHLVDLVWESEGDALLSRGWFAQPLLGWFQGWYSGGTFDSLALDLDPFSTRTVPSAELRFFFLCQGLIPEQPGAAVGCATLQLVVGATQSSGSQPCLPLSRLARVPVSIFLLQANGLPVTRGGGPSAESVGG